jgi:hypothetical protein
MRSRGGFLAALAAALVLATISSAGANVLISVDKTTQRMTVSVDGEKRYTWPVSTGRAGHGTPSGNFTPSRMEAEHYSKEWDNAPMPHSIFFTGKGHAIHGSYETRHLGSAASHGCVRISPKNATTLFALVKEQGLANTKVVLTGQAPSMIARRPGPKEAAGAPMELQQYQSAYGSQATSPFYARQPQYAQPFGQPLFGQPYNGQPAYRQVQGQAYSRTYAY